MEQLPAVDPRSIVFGKYSTEFLEEVGDLIDSPMVWELGKFEHHIDGTRLEHSISVAYYSFVLARQFGFNERECARAGLLHDLFFYDYKETDYGILHVYIHPREALENAGKLTELSDVEKEIILCHMWPTSPHRPKHPETYLVSFVDKYCATCEGVTGGWWRAWNFWKKMYASLRNYGYVQ